MSGEQLVLFSFYLHFLKNQNRNDELEEHSPSLDQITEMYESFKGDQVIIDQLLRILQCVRFSVSYEKAKITELLFDIIFTEIG